MKKYKILTVFGTRPEMIRLSRVIPYLDKFFKNILIHTNQNFDKNLNKIFFTDMNIRKPDYFLKHNKKVSSKLIGHVFEDIQKIIDKERPDAFFVLGDTNSCLSAYVAKRNKIPVFHYEAGNRSYDQNVPEEINRKIVDHISDVNFTYSESSKNNLLREGLSPEFTFKIGSPMYEVINFYMSKINNSKILQKLSMKKNNYIIVSTHREENLLNRQLFLKFIKDVLSIGKKLNKRVIFSTHPRIKALVNTLKVLDKKKVFLDPLNFTDYNFLQKNAFVVLSDSGTINEESYLLNFDAINLRDNHERHEAMENAVTIMTSYSKENIMSAIEITKKSKKLSIIPDYEIPNVSEKITKLIYSYIEKINKKIYFKYK